MYLKHSSPMNAGKGISHIQNIKGITPQRTTPRSKHVYQIYTARVSRIDRDKLVRELKKRKIGAHVHFSPPVDLMPFYRERFGFKEGDLPLTEKVAETIFTLPIYPDLEQEEIDTILSSLEEVAEELRT